ncbi:phosphodiesterase/alkaline phosphatase D [alpha proteobacterium U9-1i]|nr:phosphodiesterase/alkaline phosphatase D [alpha proteobacterium U9-1i]
MSTFNRRVLFAGASLAALPRASWAQGLSRGFFTHGVASGDPLQDSVIIWTRFVPASDGRIAWEVSEDETFARVARSGIAQARLENDFCVKIDVTGLQPGRRYFYRFLSGSDASPTGHTRTAPGGSVRSFTAALTSCSNFGFGYFHAFGDIAAREDIDVVLHVGDYIYEIRRGAYPDPDEMVAGRVIEPRGDTVTLTDYYQRYASHHFDADLLEMRRLKPLCAIWDDHEIANDAWRDGAQAHFSNQGSYADRVAAADKAFHDWLPIRRAGPGYRQYRSFDWGDLARVLLLDARFIGRDEQLDYRAFANRLAEAGANAQAVLEQFRRDGLDNPARSMLGAPQEQWLGETLRASKERGQTWQVIAQQVVLGEQKWRAGSTRMLPDGSGSRDWVSRNERLAELGISWNQDGWTGYGAARERFIGSCARDASNALVLAGDSHNCWLSNIPSAGGRRAAIEFAGGSVSSPGFERTLTNAQPGEREAAFMSANPDMAFCDVGRRGYGALRVTREGCTSEWVATSDVRIAVAAPTAITRIEAAASASGGPGPWNVTA